MTIGRWKVAKVLPRCSFGFQRELLNLAPPGGAASALQTILRRLRGNNRAPIERQTNSTALWWPDTRRPALAVALSGRRLRRHALGRLQEPALRQCAHRIGQRRVSAARRLRLCARSRKRAPL